MPYQYMVDKSPWMRRTEWHTSKVAANAAGGDNGDTNDKTSTKENEKLEVTEGVFFITKGQVLIL
jgi:hypothetical protein